MCGACTVHSEWNRPRVPVGCRWKRRPGRKSPPIEGLSPDSSHPLQKVWIDLNVPQCGYCQAGMLMAAAALLKGQAEAHGRRHRCVDHDICRCGTYPRVRAAIHKAADMMASAAGKRS